jgi:hypothetical protein
MGGSPGVGQGTRLTSVAKISSITVPAISGQMGHIVYALEGLRQDAKAPPLSQLKPCQLQKRIDRNLVMNQVYPTLWLRFVPDVLTLGAQRLTDAMQLRFLLLQHRPLPSRAGIPTVLPTRSALHRSVPR